MNKLSLKIGILFFCIIFGLITLMLFLLHEAVVENRVQEELDALQSRGNSHRTVLEKHFNKEIIDHVILMESESNTDVVITDEAKYILGSSSKLNSFEKYIKKDIGTIPYSGEIVEENWKREPVISTLSPVKINGQTQGYVYMFQNTESVHNLIQSLNKHFLLVGFISIFVTIIIIIFLSRGITKPLIQMKKATSQINKGNFAVTITRKSDDELGELAKSIETLATDLNYLKRERNEFLASISHELRTPLTYIKGYADILLKRNPPQEEREKYLTIIVTEINRLNLLIKDLFELAKIDKNSFVINKEKIDLSIFLKEIERKLTPAINEKNMNFNVHFQNNLNLFADPIRLEQILLNLLDNAIKYSKTGSLVALDVWKEKKSIHFLIKDNGKGIPEKDIPYIFNRFYRVEKSRKRSLGGTGLGLSIVQELVHAHGAEITLNSKEQMGSEFEIIFKENEK
ncbi:sensor histidine kinase [Niallia sp. JL1B1071]|uniref:sensor histidine kinase n=1 Tax=Niallia tiangongensis TaxID=3237105 RepID=UPI0037DC3079